MPFNCSPTTTYTSDVSLSFCTSDVASSGSTSDASLSDTTSGVAAPTNHVSTAREHGVYVPCSASATRYVSASVDNTLVLMLFVSSMTYAAVELSYQSIARKSIATTFQATQSLRFVPSTITNKLMFVSPVTSTDVYASQSSSKSFGSFVDAPYARLSSNVHPMLTRSKLKSTHTLSVSVLVVSNTNFEPTIIHYDMPYPMWVVAVLEELNALLANSTRAMIPLPSSRIPIGCKWIFRINKKQIWVSISLLSKTFGKGFLP